MNTIENYKEYYDGLRHFDERAVFMNSVCKLIWQSTGDCNNKAVQACNTHKDILDGFNNIRNAYELTSEVPLFAYQQLKEEGADNLGLEQDEYLDYLDDALDACVMYYGT